MDESEGHEGDDSQDPGTSEAPTGVPPADAPEVDDQPSGSPETEDEEIEPEGGGATDTEGTPEASGGSI